MRHTTQTIPFKIQKKDLKKIQKITKMRAWLRPLLCGEKILKNADLQARRVRGKSAPAPLPLPGKKGQGKKWPPSPARRGPFFSLRSSISTYGYVFF